MTLRLNGTTSGYTEIDSAAIGNNNLLTLPTTTAGTLIAADSSGVLQMNSGYGSNANAYGCRAWVNFNGQGSVAIRASGNVSSITDNGTGEYTVNFTTAMPDANYAVPITVVSGSSASAITNWQTATTTVVSNSYTNKSTTQVRIICGAGSTVDCFDVNVTIFR
jgi:hypothetical protein